MLSRAVLDHYRCPEDFLNFVPKGSLSADEGYFRFGPEAVCFGHSSEGPLQSNPAAPLYDLLSDVAIDRSKLQLPFDPTEAVENLRLERYVDHSGLTAGFHRFLKNVYYAIRPLTTQSMRQSVQRFRARDWKNRSFPAWPVDTTVEDVCARLMQLSVQASGAERIPFVWFWPGGASGCLMMTHDVENAAGRDFCGKLMDLDESFGIRSSFQIVPEQRYAVSPEFLEGIRQRGFEVAVQDLNHDGRLFDNKAEFLRRAQAINRHAREFGATGFRSAVLYRNPEWYEAFDFSYDMSMPNVGHLDPQHGGCCTVLPYFIGKILELPVTTVQDYMLFHLLQERSIDLWKKQTELILQKNGLVSFIVHPDYLLEDDTLRTYENLLSYLQEMRQRTNVWHALPGEIDSWWRARSNMRVERQGNSWRIVGEGAENAVLAYASSAGDKLVYDLEPPSKLRPARAVGAESAFHASAKI